jgi:hypothetical protein
MITDRCPHDERTPIGDLCHRCMAEGVGLIELDADGEGIATFLVPISQGLRLEDYEDLFSREERDEALVRRKLMTDEELEEGTFEAYEADPGAAEEKALEEELAWKLSGRLSEQVGEVWGRATLYIVPEPPCSSWAQALLLANPKEVRAALKGKSMPKMIERMKGCDPKRCGRGRDIRLDEYVDEGPDGVD